MDTTIRLISSLLSVATASEWRCQASNCSSPRIMMLRSGYHTCKQAEQRKQEREAERRRGVLIMCKSITYRKQFSLAQVERKLEKCWHTRTHVHTHTHAQSQIFPASLLQGRLGKTWRTKSQSLSPSVSDVLHF